MKKNILWGFLFVMLSFEVGAEVEFPVSIHSNQIQGSQDLGKINIESVGQVSFVARRNGNQLIVLATDRQGISIGKAESVIGLNQIPLYLRSPEGLIKVNIHWGSDIKGTQ